MSTQPTDNLPAEYATIRAALEMIIESGFGGDDEWAAIAALDRLAAREVPAATDAGASALEAQEREAPKCVNPSAEVLRCAMCGGEVRTCERPETEDVTDYRCPAHPHGVQLLCGRWVCSDACWEKATQAGEPEFLPATPPAPPAAECAARLALKRNRQRYANILENRQLTADVWGTRNGYGGRYGALTREELEQVIAECDAALATPCQHGSEKELQITEGVIRSLKEELAEHEASFDLRWKADMQAIKRWRAATGRTLVLPDHADLCVWLLEHGSEQSEIARLRAELEDRCAEYDEAVRNASELHSAAIALRAELAQARKATEEAQEMYESEEKAHVITIGQRDAAEEAADKLAYTIGSVEEIGEHSNLNDPWENAANLLVEQQRDLAAELSRAVDALEAARALIPRIEEAFAVGVNETTYCLVWPEVSTLSSAIAAYDAKHGEQL